jgi:PAS domain S-box-containing protein
LKSSEVDKSAIPKKVYIYWVLAFMLWSGLIAFLAWQETGAGERLVYQLAEAEARGSFYKDLTYRRWAAKQGGLYVRRSDYTPPNPYLSHIPNRDLSTIAGVDLTLVNPAYMTRQVHELSATQYGTRGHITSLDPLRPENDPDDWEKKVLESFELGSSEFSEKTLIDGISYLRMMFAMTTEEFCLKCHAHQGYQVGDIRGGISLSIPLRPYLLAYQANNSAALVNKVIIWSVGLLLISISFLPVRKYFQREYNIKKLLESSEKKYRKLFNDATVGFCLADAESGEILECNEALATMVERSVDELIGQSQSILQAEGPVLDGKTETFIRHRREKSGSVLPSKLVTRRGREFAVEIKANCFSREGDDFIFGIFHDVSERAQAELVLRESEEKYRALLNNQNDAIYLHKAVTDNFSTLIEVNEAVVERYGYSREELLKMSIEDLVAPAVLKKQREERHFSAVLDSGHQTYGSELVTRQGDHIPVEISTTVVELQGEMYFLSIARDMTERQTATMMQKELESQLRQKYKMEAVGTMAGGIAHDFNNILAVIMTNLELMNRKAREDNPLLPRIEQARAAAMRASELVKQILTYSRQGEQNLKPVKLAEDISDTLRLLRSTIPASIEILKNIDDQIKDSMVDADPIQIEEVLVNLCTNAAYAMGEKGLLTVSLSLESLQDGQLPMQPASLSGDCFRMDITDTGSGMTPELVEKIFDPFYTTKPEGAGTGMGLAISHGIIGRHNGLLTVASSPGEGSTFSIYLPLSEKVNEGFHEESWEEVVGGSENILFIDDEETLARSISDYFVDYGYCVTYEVDSLKAFELFKQEPQKFDLIITDQTMPGKTGLELIQDVLAIRPDMPIVLCTGYSATVTEAKALESGAMAFLLKPVNLPGMVKAARTILDGNK